MSGEEGEFVFTSSAMRAVLDVVEQVKDSRVPVMILGESGTGKEVVARLLHRRSKRRDAPFVAVNCAALPRELADSELFGHEKGAFTGAATRRTGRFEEAGKGTLFLDEVGELDAAIQAKLLRALQEAEVTRVGGQTVKVEARVVVATNRSLSQELRSGRFRQDLYHRLNVITIGLPPLRERPEEIPALAQHLLDRFARDEDMPPKRLDDSALAALAALPWPGNVRQLQNVIKRSVLLAKSDVIGKAELALQGASAIEIEAFDPGQLSGAEDEEEAAYESLGAEYRRQIEDSEREVMLKALDEASGNVSEAARLLGIGRATFYRRAKRLGIDR